MSTGRNLIFLISQPRAGSTLLQKVLGAHPHIHTLSEPWIALHPLFALRPQGVSAQYCHFLAQQATSQFLGQIPGGEDTYYHGVRLLLNHLYDAALAPAAKPLFLDKTPRYYLILPELKRVFPDARFVFLVRNPLAVFASILEAWVKEPIFGDQYAFRADLVHDLLTAPEVIAGAIASLGPNETFIAYESLVNDPATVIAALCRRLDIPFHPEMIEYGAKSSVPWPFGDQGVVNAESRPIPTRAERWRKVLLSPARNTLARAYLAALGPGLTARLGYQFEALADALNPSGQREKPAEFLKTAVLTPAYGESCDYVSHLGWFQDVIRRAAATPRAVGAAPSAG